MKILIAANNGQNSYIASLANAYKRAGCEVVVDVDNFFLSNYHPDILHLHWPDYLYLPDHNSLFGEPAESIPRIIKQHKDRGATVVYTVHNLRPHLSCGASFEQDIYQAIYALSDIIVHHGNTSVNLLSEEFPPITEKNNIVCPHGDYLIQHKSIPKNKAREQLGLPLDRFVLLYFGSIRNYKGFTLLNKIYGQWKNPNKYLLVAGEYSATVGDSVPARLGVKVRKTLLSWRNNPFVSDRRYDFAMIKTSDISQYFSAADVVILTHTSGLTSGILAMAATFNKPVICPDIGNFREQMEGWLFESYTMNDVTTAVDALQRLSDRIDHESTFDNSAWLRKNSWKEHVEKILSAVQDFRR
jgi:beta-1,4-mannosyltransferase